MMVRAHAIYIQNLELSDDSTQPFEREELKNVKKEREKTRTKVSLCGNQPDFYIYPFVMEARHVHTQRSTRDIFPQPHPTPLFFTSCPLD